MKIGVDNFHWNINIDSFKTTKKGLARNIMLPDFSTKHVVLETKIYINLSHKQKYKAIFSLDQQLTNHYVAWNFGTNGHTTIKQRNHFTVYAKIMLYFPKCRATMIVVGMYEQGVLHKATFHH